MKCRSQGLTGIENDDYYQLKRCNLDITPDSHNNPTTKSWENERFDRGNEKVKRNRTQSNNIKI